MATGRGVGVLNIPLLEIVVVNKSGGSLWEVAASLAQFSGLEIDAKGAHSIQGGVGVALVLPDGTPAARVYEWGDDDARIERLLPFANLRPLKDFNPSENYQ